VIRRAGVVLVTTLVASACVEALTRRIDGYKVWSWRLQRIRYAQPTDTPDRQYLESIPLATGVDRAWYEQAPPPIPRLPMPAAMQARFEANKTNPYNAFMVWNADYLRFNVCESDDHGVSTFGNYRDFLVYDPPAGGGPYPTYRHVPRLGPPGMFVANSFGWRGPDLSVARPPNTIRIAFVGASTTIDPYYLPYSHIELVGHWLNEWAAAKALPIRFEVINAARTGIDSPSIREIVRQEVLAVDPELIVYYEGANNFAPGMALRLPDTLPKAPKATFHVRGKAEEYSAVAARLYDAALKRTGRGGYEPPKPAYAPKWIDGVSEDAPDSDAPRLPMEMQLIARNLAVAQAAAASNGTELAIASFVWMVYPGMRLDLTRHLVLFRYLNESYFPSTYAHMRRMADFQNRVFRGWAQKHGAIYLPMDETFPRNPDLFDDAIHMTERGLRLQAWIYLQQLVPIIQSRIDSRQWPKRPAASPVSAAWATTPPRTVSRASILASCPRTVH